MPSTVQHWRLKTECLSLTLAGTEADSWLPAESDGLVIDKHEQTDPDSETLGKLEMPSAHFHTTTEYIFEVGSGCAL